ncbi:MAG: GTP-binding protein [Deltaproteobacteria bacterium]|nr:GTP-binding protein [Deltaproteobacteria bacterium]
MRPAARREEAWDHDRARIRILDLNDGTHFGIVDVPGHERFVRTMVAGAGGIDLIMLVVAADEGVMPQTREHFEVCRLLDVRAGLVALTKSDLVDAEMLDLARRDVADFVRGSFLDGAPIVPVSSATGDGKERLLAALGEQARKARAKNATDLLRLPIDRVFTMKGFGTVVTGTMIGGSVTVGDDVVILPSGTKTRVRGLQVHGKKVNEAAAGFRAAVNLQGTPRDGVVRGEVVTHAGTLGPTRLVDARVEMLSGAPRPLKTRSRVRFHAFTSEIFAQAYPLDAEEIAPGKSGLVQLRLDEEAVVQPGDRFVLPHGLADEHRGRRRDSERAAGSPSPPLRPRARRAAHPRIRRSRRAFARFVPASRPRRPAVRGFAGTSRRGDQRASRRVRRGVLARRPCMYRRRRGPRRRARDAGRAW